MKINFSEISESVDEMLEDGTVEVAYRDPNDNLKDRYRITDFGKYIHDSGHDAALAFLSLPKEWKLAIRKYWEENKK